MMDDLLRVRGLSTRFFTEMGQVNAVENVDFTIGAGEMFGIVGESGSGKSVTARSLMDLIEPPGRVTSGEIWYRNAELATTVDESHPDAVDGDFVDILRLSDQQRHRLRGSSFSMIFQDPMSSLNPSLTVGRQIAEAAEVQRRIQANPRSTRSRTQGFGLGSFLLNTAVPFREYVSEESKERAVELLGTVGIPDPEERAEEYPHQFSGGMLQRAMIAQALAGEPDLLIADEPTTALDVTIQAEVLNLLSRLQDDTNMSVLLITHNLGIVSRVCDRVGVMYAGEIVERGTLSDILEDSIHPYTEGLLASVPDITTADTHLQPIEGNVPSLIDAEMGDQCSFADRCPKAMDRCVETKPPDFAGTGSSDHHVQCVLAEQEYDPEAALPNEQSAPHMGDDA